MNMNSVFGGNGGSNHNGPKSNVGEAVFVNFPEIEEEAKLLGVKLTVMRIDRTKIDKQKRYQHRDIPEQAVRASVEAIKLWFKFGRREMRRCLVLDYGNGNYALYDGNHRFLAAIDLKIPEIECYVMPVGTEHTTAQALASNVNDRHGTRLAPDARINLAYNDWAYGVKAAKIPDGKDYRKMIADSHSVVPKHLDERIEVGMVDDWLDEMKVKGAGFKSSEIKRKVILEFMKSLGTSPMTADQRKAALIRLGDIIASTGKVRGITNGKVIDAWKDAGTCAMMNQTNILDEFAEKLKASREEAIVIRQKPVVGNGLTKTFIGSINQLTAMLREQSDSVAAVATGDDKAAILARLRELIPVIEGVISSPNWDIPFFSQGAR